MKNWMIAADGSAVNLDRVERISVGRNNGGWYALARLAGIPTAGVRLVDDLPSREAAQAWIAKVFGDVDEHALTALDLVNNG